MHIEIMLIVQVAVVMVAAPITDACFEAPTDVFHNTCTDYLFQ
jgi:hypothetical protein